MENSEIASKMQEALEKAGGLEKSVKFDFWGRGICICTWHISRAG